MERKTKIALVLLATLTTLLFIQAFIFPIFDVALFYVLFKIEEHYAPVELYYSIINRDNATHTVYVEVSKADTGDVIYRANHTIGADDFVHSKPITREAGKYRVKVVMDGKIKKEKCVCVEKFTGGVHMMITRYNGKLDIRMAQGTF